MIDSHAHLNEVADLDGALKRARDAGIHTIVSVGMDLDSNRKTLELAKRFPELVRSAIGYHPWSIEPEHIEENLAFIESNLAGCIAVGEVGLDYRAKAKKPLQWEVFSRLIDIAMRHSLPLIVHCRFSHERAHRMLTEAGVERAVFHWYSGGIDILDKIVHDGYFVSASPALAYSPQHQAAIVHAPLDRILIETDAPVEYEGRTSEPADLVITLRELSRLKGMDAGSLERITDANSRNFFGIS